jgi:hypothetical protein
LLGDTEFDGDGELDTLTDALGVGITDKETA